MNDRGMTTVPYTKSKVSVTILNYNGPEDTE